jgi:hypothetical protein
MIWSMITLKEERMEIYGQPIDLKKCFHIKDVLYNKKQFIQGRQD